MSGIIPSSDSVVEGKQGNEVLGAESAVGVVSGGGAALSGFVTGITGFLKT